MSLDRYEVSEQIMQITEKSVRFGAKGTINTMYFQIHNFFMHLNNFAVCGDILYFLSPFCKNITWIFQDDILYDIKKKKEAYLGVSMGVL